MVGGVSADQVDVALLLLRGETRYERALGVVRHQCLSRPEEECVWVRWLSEELWEGHD